jgi:multiple sugar transport system permease protein
VAFPYCEACHLRTSARSPRTHKQLGRRSAPYLFILPSFAVFLLFIAYPLIDTVVASFQDVIAGRQAWVGLDNYHALLTDQIFQSALKNTALYVLLMVPGGVVLAVILAGLITAIRSNHMQTFFKAAFYLPIATISSVMLALVWNYIYDPTFGLFNYILTSIGLPAQLWLNSPHTALISLVIMMHTQWWGGMIILLVASIGSIPPDLYEAATIDGATKVKQFIYITLPLTRPAIAYVAVIATISSFRIFNEIDIMTQGGPNFSTTNIAYDIYETGINEFQFGSAASMSTVLLVITVIVAIVQYRIINQQLE